MLVFAGLPADLGTQLSAYLPLSILTVEGTRLLANFLGALVPTAAVS